MELAPGVYGVEVLAILDCSQHDLDDADDWTAVISDFRVISPKKIIGVIFLKTIIEFGFSFIGKKKIGLLQTDREQSKFGRRF